MLPLLLVCALLAACAGAFAFHRISSWVSKRRLSRRFAKGIQGEQRGERILQRAGYEITALQPNLEGVAYIDGQRCSYGLRPDGLAVRGSQRYAFEIKTGRVAVNPLYRETRRQILEYFFFFPIDGILLVDADAGTIQQITFGDEEEEQEEERSRWMSHCLCFLGGLGLGMVIWIWWSELR